MKNIIYIVLLTTLSFVSYASGGDTTKVKYDINDPRNPDCPCHKYQQLADEEYQRMIANEDIQQASKEIGEKIVAFKNKDVDYSFMNAADDNSEPSSKNNSGSDLKIGTSSGTNAGSSSADNSEPSSKSKPGSDVKTGVAAASDNAHAGSASSNNNKASSKNSAGSELKKVKVKKSAFSKRGIKQHKNHSPKKRRVRFGRKDNSRCTKW